MNAAQVSLVVASMDLKMIQSVVRAMRAADVAGARTRPPVNPVEDRRIIHRTPLLAPRQVIHPTPRVEPRPVIHLAPRTQVEPGTGTACPEAKVRSKITPSPIEPPWKKLPWQQPAPEVVVIKQVISKTDIRNKGSLLDLVV